MTSYPAQHWETPMTDYTDPITKSKIKSVQYRINGGHWDQLKKYPDGWEHDGLTPEQSNAPTLDEILTSRKWRGEKMQELAAENKRLREALREAITDNVWDSYNTGIERDGKWMDGCLSSAEWITRELGLGSGWHDADTVKSMFPALVDDLVARAALGDANE